MNTVWISTTHAHTQRMAFTGSYASLWAEFVETHTARVCVVCRWAELHWYVNALVTKSSNGFNLIPGHLVNYLSVRKPTNSHMNQLMSSCHRMFSLVACSTAVLPSDGGIPPPCTTSCRLWLRASKNQLITCSISMEIFQQRVTANPNYCYAKLYYLCFKSHTYVLLLLYQLHILLFSALTVSSSTWRVL